MNPNGTGEAEQGIQLTNDDLLQVIGELELSRRGLTTLVSRLQVENHALKGRLAVLEAEAPPNLEGDGRQAGDADAHAGDARR